MTERPPVPRSGQRVVVRTPDRREWGGVAVAVRTADGAEPAVEVRLDTGWVTTYPLRMVFAAEEE